MSNVYRQVYLHLVWSTRKRQHILTAEVETFVHARMAEICDNLNLRLLIANSAWDHTHSLVEWNTSTSIGDGVRELKSRTTTEWNARVRAAGIGQMLTWQRGYGVVSIRKSDISTVVAYIRDQKTRHKNKRIWGPFEQSAREDEGESLGTANAHTDIANTSTEADAMIDIANPTAAPGDKPWGSSKDPGP